LIHLSQVHLTLSVNLNIGTESSRNHIKIGKIIILNNYTYRTLMLLWCKRQQFSFDGSGVKSRYLKRESQIMIWILLKVALNNYHGSKPYQMGWHDRRNDNKENIKLK
jgi:hypothetical protein